MSPERQKVVVEEITPIPVSMFSDVFSVGTDLEKYGQAWVRTIGILVFALSTAYAAPNVLRGAEAASTQARIGPTATRNSTPEATALPLPSFTPTPEAGLPRQIGPTATSGTPEATAPSLPTFTPAPESTSTSTPPPTATETQVSTQRATPSETSTLNSTPRPTSTENPTASRTPTITSVPEKTLTSTVTPEATEVPTPTSTPKPQPTQAPSLEDSQQRSEDKEKNQPQPAPTPEPTPKPELKTVGTSFSTRVVETETGTVRLLSMADGKIISEIPVGFINRSGVVSLRGVIREPRGPTYAVVRREADGKVVRVWIHPASKIRYSVDWKEAIEKFSFNEDIVMAIPLDEKYPHHMQLVKIFGPYNDDRIFAFSERDGLWHYINDIETFNRLGLDWKDVLAADDKFFGRVAQGDALMTLVKKLPGV